jgi:hypothetical protein
VNGGCLWLSTLSCPPLQSIHPSPSLPEAEEFNLKLKDLEATTITRHRTYLLQDKSMIEELEAAKDRDEQIRRMRAHLKAIKVNDEKAEEAAELELDLSERQGQRQVNNIGSMLLARSEVDEELVQLMGFAAPAAPSIKQHHAAAAAANPAAVQQASKFLPCVTRHWARSPPPGLLLPPSPSPP